MAILAEGNWFSVLFGLVVIAFPYILTGGAITVIMSWQIRYTPLRITLIFLPSLLFAPVSLFGPICALVVIMHAVLMISQRTVAVRISDSTLGSFVVRSGVIVGVVMAIWMILTSTMWLPREVVSTADNSYEGYILSEGDREIVVLEETDRRVRRLLVDNVLERNYCEDSPSRWDQPLLAFVGLFKPPADYPDCRDLMSTISEEAKLFTTT
jgi:hypothetical protein